MQLLSCVVIKAAMATLVKRSDAPLYRVFVGDDWKLFAYNLSQEQCFEVNAVLHAPLAESDAQEKVTAAIRCLGIPLKRNGWFEASQDQAMQVLAATLSRAAEDEYCTQPSCGALPKSDVPAPKRRRGPKCALPVPEGEECQEAAPIPAADPAAPAEEIDASTSAPDSPESCVIRDEDVGAMDAVSEEGVENDPLWEYVVPCTARDAAKAVDLRAVLEAQCGKEVAKSLLAHTKATVAQDSCGKKNRVLKLGGSFIKLKSEV